MKPLLILLSLLTTSWTLHAEQVVNVYAWGGIIPKIVIQQFEQDTGIKVHFSTYDSNETMMAKLRASKQPIYDVVLPSAYFVERMRKLNLLTQLDHQQLPNLNFLSAEFQNQDYDPENQYSAPLIWGATGIFYNKKWVKNPPKSWKDLWQNQWKNKLMLLDDSRDTFASAMLFLHHSPNDRNPVHIEQAFQALIKLIPNIKLFTTEGIQAIMIDEDAISGIAWNGDAYKANKENPNITFVYPEEGFVIWIDCLAIPHNAPHSKEAYAFINYLFKPEISALIAQKEGHAITNEVGKNLLPEMTQKNQMVYPSQDILKRGIVQRDVGESVLRLYNDYWQTLKLSF